jgi:hypothetical protein
MRGDRPHFANCISAGVVGNVTQLTFDPSRDVIRFNFRTLVEMNADSFTSTLAWTATDSGDIITYTIGPVPVPEPSSALLVGLGGLALLARRKKA